jgi:hypothetical protein
LTGGSSTPETQVARPDMSYPPDEATTVPDRDIGTDVDVKP